MKSTFAMFAVASAVLVAGFVVASEPVVSNPKAAKAPVPHCEVPCGIYADQMRFEQMLEDTKTIAKAIKSINEFADGLNGDSPTGKGINQAMRWVTTKETHATNTQHIISQYFLTQRIKSDNKEYVGQLATAHKVLVAAMKCKQDSNPATAEALKKSIYDLYRAYEGKEPQFEGDK
ncbi:MAG: superoxide dismutase [Ni] [Mariniblastus sp.]